MAKPINLPNGRSWRTQTAALAHFKDMLRRITIHPKLDAFDAEAIERFGQIMRQNITTGPDPIQEGLHQVGCGPD